jgi:L-threonylcarbamoyladenylate synthase
MVPSNLAGASLALKNGQVIAYPTEAVYGLGCDPFNQQAVTQLLALKQRAVDKGLILVIASWQQLEPLIAQPLEHSIQTQLQNDWPGPTTFLLPPSERIPAWIRGKHAYVAIRFSQHPVITALCQAYGGAIVSTSANRQAEPAITDRITLQKQFGDTTFIVDGALGTAKTPSRIIDPYTGTTIRN